MKKTVSDFVVQRLHDWGVRRVYGYPGDGINGLMGALDRADGAIEFIQSRHEELAAFMACAHAKFSGEVGVCLATSGPGAIHLLNGLYDAKLDRQPVVAIVGQQQRSALGGDYQQEVDLVSLFKDVAHEFVQMATSAQQLRHLIDRAMRIARDRRAVTCVIVPNDMQELPAVPVPPRRHGTVHSCIGSTASAAVPNAAALGQAADIINAGSKVAILAGAGALHATDELIHTAERLGARIAKALLGKAAVPDDLPFVTGAIGVLGTRPSSRMMEDCDTLLMVGSSFPYAEFLPPGGQARCVQIDTDPRAIGLRYPTELGLVGDSRATLAALLPLLDQKEHGAWRQGDWADPRLVVMVLNNRDLNLVSWEQRMLGGYPKFNASQELPDLPYARFAEMLGLAALRVDAPEAIGPAWDAAFAADRPMLLEMVTDSAVPPLPPDVSLAQAKAYLRALWQGDPEAMRTIKATMREYWASATA
ncbi:hypothetical protein EH244_16545 [Variovorax beijingensis]|uniref:Thiamine pyrophosphate-requiring protein n=1 Tax=Variovorax beijingensis TaxID=2496117 RepID=A0A3P3EN28_9BURK|nr:thiamine pyrophosphate-binding protein [Variovorax beijingensis]RRH87657.1 hypothetical protein EH244_16545 [Variovorax beijingensis]